MDTRTETISFDAVERKDVWMIHGMGFAGLGALVLWKMATAEYGDTPFFAMLFVFAISCCFLIFLAVGLSMLALCAGKIVIDREEIKLCVGQLILKRIPVGEIRTVAFGYASFGRYSRTIDVPMLILSAEDAEQLVEKGSRIIRRKSSLRQQLRSMGFDPDSRKSCAYVALCEKIVAYLLPWKKGMLMGFSVQRTELLRRHLPGSEFLV